MSKTWIVIICLAGGAIIAALSWQKIYKAVTPPSPVVVSSHADNNYGLFDYSITVFGDISNKGGDGDVVVEVTVYQDNNHWTKTKALHMASYQTEKVAILFDEVKFLDKNPKYSIRAYPLGSNLVGT